MSSKDAQIARIDEISRVARTSWFGLLAYLAFVGVTLLGVEDADFFIVERQTRLPLIGVDIPTAAFFRYAPILGAALHIYLHLQLLKLWEALAEPPSKVDGVLLGDQVMPWLINDFALWFRTDQAIRRRPLRWLTLLITFLLTFTAGPMVLSWFWVRYWPAHDGWWTVIIAFTLSISTITALVSFLRVWSILRRRDQARPVVLRGLFEPLTVLALFVPLSVVSWLSTVGPDRSADEPILAFPVALGTWEYTLRVPVSEGAMDAFPLAAANLVEVQFVDLPPDWLEYDVHKRRFRTEWCDRQGIPTAACGQQLWSDESHPPHQAIARERWCEESGLNKAANCDAVFVDLDLRFINAWRDERRAAILALPDRLLAGVDFRNANLAGASLIGADLRFAQLAGANLSGTQLEGVNLQDATADLVTFAGARLEGADLSFSSLERATFLGARMEGAILAGAALVRAEMGGAQLQGANLEQATLTDATLSVASLELANLLGATLDGARFLNASLRGARLDYAMAQGAMFVDADLSDTFMIYATLRGARMRNANLTGAVAHYADLQAQDLTQSQLRSVLGTRDTILPVGLNVWTCWHAEERRRLALLNVRRYAPFAIGNQDEVADLVPLDCPRFGAPEAVGYACFEEGAPYCEAAPIEY
ncbi:MAG: pentapeptide repeat-containing protein [Pseudomonadota bacterium]